MKLTDCYFEKKDWRACQKEVIFSLISSSNSNISLTISYRCKYSKNAGNAMETFNGPKQKINEIRACW